MNECIAITFLEMVFNTHLSWPIRSSSLEKIIYAFFTRFNVQLRKKMFAKIYFWKLILKPELRLKTKALGYKFFFVKALSKWLRKLMIKTKQLSRLKSSSFINVND